MTRTSLRKLLIYCIALLNVVCVSTLNAAEVDLNHLDTTNKRVLLTLEGWINEQSSLSLESTDYHLSIRIKPTNQWLSQSQSDPNKGALLNWLQRFTLKISDYFTPPLEQDSVTDIQEITISLKPLKPTKLDENTSTFSLDLRAEAYRNFIALGYNPKLITVTIEPTEETNKANAKTTNADPPTVSADTLRIGNSNQEHKPNQFLIRNTIVQWLLLAIILIAITIIWKIYGKNHRASHQRKATNLPGQLEEITLQKRIPPSANEVKETANEAIPELLNPSSTPDHTTTASELREKIIQTGLQHPYFFRQLYEVWQHKNTSNVEHTDNLQEKTSVLYDIFGKISLHIAIPSIDNDDYLAIAHQTNELKKNASSWKKIQQSVDQDVNQLVDNLQKPDPYQEPFGFIKAMPDSIISSLLKNKAIHIQAITLAQFDAARCQALLLGLSDDSNADELESKTEHYRQFNGYFFHDVASYLASVFSQIVFKDKSIPFDDVRLNHPKDPHQETRRALDDMSRQISLGLHSMPPLDKTPSSSPESKKQPNQDEWFDFSRGA